jgi:hypothetical protein
MGIEKIDSIKKDCEGSIDIMGTILIVGFIAMSGVMMCVFFDIGVPLNIPVGDINTHKIVHSQIPQRETVAIAYTDADLKNRAKFSFMLILLCVCFLIVVGYCVNLEFRYRMKELSDRQKKD